MAPEGRGLSASREVHRSLQREMEHRDVVGRDKYSFVEARVCKSGAILLPVRVEMEHACSSFSLLPTIETLGWVVGGPCLPVIANMVRLVFAWRTLMVVLAVALAVVPVRDRLAGRLDVEEVVRLFVYVSEASFL